MIVANVDVVVVLIVLVALMCLMVWVDPFADQPVGDDEDTYDPIIERNP